MISRQLFSTASLRQLLLSGALVLQVLAPSPAQACIWIHGTTLDGRPIAHSPNHPAEWISYAMDQTPAQRLEEISKAKPGNTREQKENRAVALILEGKPREAIQILQELEKESPGEYTVAANLGTAYELAGDLENASFWIKEGIRLNPASHSGTEWLHALILETKIRLQKDPAYLATHRIIPLPERFNSSTKIALSGTEYTVPEIETALAHQLRERCVFVKPPDPVVADLLFTFARSAAQTGVVEEGLTLLGASEKYGFADPKLLGKTRAEYEAIKQLGEIRRAENLRRRRAYGNLTVILVCSVLLGSVYFCYRKGWLFRRRLEKKQEASRLNNPGGSPEEKAEEPASKS